MLRTGISSLAFSDGAPRHPAVPSFVRRGTRHQHAPWAELSLAGRRADWPAAFRVHGRGSRQDAEWSSEGTDAAAAVAGAGAKAVNANKVGAVRGRRCGRLDADDGHRPLSIQ